MGVLKPNNKPLNTSGNKKYNQNSKKIYSPIKKHEPGGFGSPNPITSKKIGQSLLDNGIPCGKQIYNITSDGKIVKFQPDNTPENGYHAYEVFNKKDIPTIVLKTFVEQGKLTISDYKKYINNKKKKGYIK